MPLSTGAHLYADELHCNKIGDHTNDQAVDEINVRSNVFLHEDSLVFKHLPSKNTLFSTSSDSALTLRNEWDLDVDSSSNRFVIRHSESGDVVLSIDPTTKLVSIPSISGGGGEGGTTLTLPDLTPISTIVLTDFNAVLTDVDNAHRTKLVTAEAIRSWVEDTLLPSSVRTSNGIGGLRVGSINALSPSSFNVPSCLAVSDFVNASITNTLLKNTQGQIVSVSESITDDVTTLPTSNAVYNFVLDTLYTNRNKALTAYLNAPDLNYTNNQNINIGVHVNIGGNSTEPFTVIEIELIYSTHFLYRSFQAIISDNVTYFDATTYDVISTQDGGYRR
eukprot:5317161-Pleurochrysis_carterae.AAC.2